MESFFTKAEFFEKAIEILNKQKDIAENVLYDYNMVSLIVVSYYEVIIILEILIQNLQETRRGSR